MDSGADVSVFPASSAQKLLPSTSVLSADNGSYINTFGKRDILLALPGLSVVHQFVLADIRNPILGSDFFRRHNLLIDIPKQRLVREFAVPGPLRPEVVVRARPARVTGGLCGLRSGLSPFSSVDSVFAAFPAVTSTSPVYDATPVSYTHLTLPTILLV